MLKRKFFSILIVCSFLLCLLCMPANASAIKTQVSNTDAIEVSLESLTNTLDLSADTLKEIEKKAEGAESLELGTATFITADGKSEDVYVVNITSEHDSTKALSKSGDDVKVMKVESLVLLSQWSKVGSNGKYDISVRVCVYYNLSGSGATQKGALTAVQGRIDDAGTNTIYVKKFLFDGHVLDTSGLFYNYRKTFTVSYPSSGAYYYQSLNSGYYSTVYGIGSMYEAQFSDGSSLLSWVYI